MGKDKVHPDLSLARTERRKVIANAAMALMGADGEVGFDPVHAPLCAIDVVMVAGAPWLRDGLQRDFSKDESGYRKIGGGANTPAAAYFFRSTANLVHYLKRQGFYVPRGASTKAAVGMACFFDWDDRGRFNFTPDRSGIIVKIEDDTIREVVMAIQVVEDKKTLKNTLVKIDAGSGLDRALIGYSDLP